MLRREDFTIERVRAYAEQLAKQNSFPLMSEAAREASRIQVMREIAPGADVWVFGYGSLMWNPAIHVAETRHAVVHGYHREFCLTLHMGRGTPDRPGLMLGLDAGGQCIGVAHRIAAGNVDSELTVLWYREMLSGAYRPTWVEAEIADHGRVRALTFVISREHPRYEGQRDEETVAQRIADAEGILGTNRDYLYRTVRHLDEMGIADPPLHRIAARVREILNEPDIQGEDNENGGI